MRILNVTQSYDPFFEFGGPPVKVKALAEGLAGRGHAVTVLTADWGVDKRLRERPGEGEAKPSPFGRKRETHGVTTIYLPNWGHYRAMSWNPALPRYLRARLKDFDVVHIFGLYDLLGATAAARCRAEKIPYVVEPIGMFVPMVRSILLKKVYHKLLGTAMLCGASAIVATSDQEQRELEAGGIPPKQIVLRWNGVEAPTALPERELFRKRVGIPGQAKVILFLGRLSAKKSPDLLLQAFGELCKRQGELGRSWHLVFVGPDEAGMRARLESMAAQLGLGSRVHLIEAIHGREKWEAYVDADIFVLPSQNENFGNTAAESVAAGTPAIVTDRCGIAPLLEGVAGLVVGHDRGGLSEALEMLLLNETLYEKLREGCSKITKSLGWEQPIAAMELLYNTVAGGTKP